MASKHLHPSDFSSPSCDQLLSMQQDISVFFVDEFMLLPATPVCGRVVRPVEESYRQFEMQWKLTH